MSESVLVPEMAKQTESTPNQEGKVEHDVWTERMLAALVTVSKGADGHKPNAEFAHLRLRHHVQLYLS